MSQEAGLHCAGHEIFQAGLRNTLNILEISVPTATGMEWDRADEVANGVVAWRQSMREIHEWKTRPELHLVTDGHPRSGACDMRGGVRRVFFGRP